VTTKTIVRYLPPNPIVGARELSSDDFKSQGVFTQKKKLLWQKENGFWLDADDAKISPEALAWLEERTGEFKVERQEIPDDDTEAEATGTAKETSSGKAVEGEQPVGGGTPGTTTGTTTQSTARR